MQRASRRWARIARLRPERSPTRATTRVGSDEGASLGDRVVRDDEDHRAEERHHEAGGLTVAVPAEGAAEKASQERAEHAEDHRDDPAAGLFAGDDEAGEGADDEAENEKQDDAHGNSPTRNRGTTRVGTSPGAWPAGPFASPVPPPARRASRGKAGEPARDSAAAPVGQAGEGWGSRGSMRLASRRDAGEHHAAAWRRQCSR